MTAAGWSVQQQTSRSGTSGTNRLNLDLGSARMPTVDFRHTLQVVGAVCELFGVGTVAVGIGRMRARYTAKSFVLTRLWEATKRLVGRVRHTRRDVTLTGEAALIGFSGMRGYATVTLGSGEGVPVEEMIERMRHRVNEHAEQLTRIEARMDDEQEARRKAEEQGAREGEVLAQELRDALADLAAGGLRLESVGVVALVLGIVLGAWGNFIS